MIEEAFCIVRKLSFFSGLIALSRGVNNVVQKELFILTVFTL